MCRTHTRVTQTQDLCMSQNQNWISTFVQAKNQAKHFSIELPPREAGAEEGNWDGGGGEKDDGNSDERGKEGKGEREGSKVAAMNDSQAQFGI